MAVKVAGEGGGLESHDIQFSQLTLALTSTGTTNVVNVSEKGVLIAYSMRTQTGISGAPSVNLELTIDGGVKRTFRLWDGDTFWRVTDIGHWKLNGNGAAADSSLVVNFGGIRYQSSLLIAINILTAASGGTMEANVIRGTVL